MTSTPHTPRPGSRLRSPRGAALRSCAILSIAALALASCGGSSEPAESGDEVPEAAVAEDQDLVVALTTDVDNLLPWTATQFQATNVLRNIYGTLTELDHDLEVVPGLAEDWEISDDGLTATFHLREGVTFFDGAELTAEDVVASFEAIQDPDTAAAAATNLASVESIEATDDHTVTMNLSTPDTALFSKVALGNAAILPADADLEELETEPNGTGPFSLSERVANDSLTLEANPDYWGEGPHLDTVEFRVIPDESAIVSALQAGSVHMATFDDPLVADTIGAGVEILETPQLTYHVLQLRADEEPLDDVNVRRALACTIDRQEVLDSAAMGAGEVVGPFTSPAHLSDPDSRPCPEPDLDRAEEYLAEAGYEDGLELSAIVMSDGYSTAVAEGETIQAQLAQVGIDLSLEVLESGSYVDRWVDADFTLAVARNAGNPDPDVTYGRYFRSDGNFNEVAGYRSDALDELFEQGLAETDEEARAEIYEEISDYLEEQAVWIWLFAGYEYTALTEEVSGYTAMANSSMQGLRDAVLVDH